MVICKGTSPGAAANRVINNMIVQSERAQIVMIPPQREADFLPFEDRLLSLSDIKALFPKEPLTPKYLDI